MIVHNVITNDQLIVMCLVVLTQVVLEPYTSAMGQAVKEEVEPVLMFFLIVLYQSYLIMHLT